MPDPKTLAACYSQLLAEANDRFVNANAENARLKAIIGALEAQITQKAAEDVVAKTIEAAPV